MSPCVYRDGHIRFQIGAPSVLEKVAVSYHLYFSYQFHRTWAVVVYTNIYEKAKSKVRLHKSAFFRISEI